MIKMLNIELINNNREKLGYKPITGIKNVESIENWNENSELVLTFVQWKKEGYKINKGAKSVQLKAPLMKKDKDTGDYVPTGKYRFFRVFDISQVTKITGEA